MSLKLFSIAKNGKMLRVGDSSLPSDKAPWYSMTDELVKIFPSKGFAVNDIVTIETNLQGGGQNFITSINKVGTTDSTPVKTTNAVSTGATDKGAEVQVTTQKKPYLPKEEWIADQKAKGLWKENTLDKGTDVNSSIKRQAIGHATSRTIIGMQGTVTPDNVCDVIRSIYKTYEELVG